ncbi:MAG: DNA-directed RNA polymerase subunit omega [Candidatus Omnitrophica bacterium]|nr:DNA-directed RNA polymerase subunit omega [Candidatus Omnitrophota bacterium]
MEKLIENTGSSKYKLVILAAKRALELSEGAPRLVDVSVKAKPAIVALKEIAAGKVTMKLLDGKKGRGSKKSS